MKKPIQSAFSILCIGLALSAVAVSAKAKTRASGEGLSDDMPSKALRFLVMGDWGRNGYPNQTAVAREMGKVAEDSGAAFVVAPGDNFYPNGVRSVQDPLWMESFESIYTNPSLMRDWYVVLGNHDYHGNPQAEVDYTQISRRWNMPARYYEIHKKIKGDPAGADLFFLDTSPFQSKYYGDETNAGSVIGQDTAAQRRWLDSALSASHATWKLVFGHHPVYTSGAHAKEMALMPDQFGSLFEKSGVDVYFAGHDHDFEHLENNGVNYFVVGTGSELRPLPAKRNPYSKFGLSAPGFGVVSITPKELRFSFIDKSGKRPYQTVIRKALQ